MLVFEDSGVFIGKDLAIDPGKKCKARNSIITHAHSDHACINSTKSCLLTPETHSFVESRFGKMKNAKIARFGERINLDGTKVSLHNAGHILGSCQVLVEADKTIAFTSDFKMQGSAIQEPAEQLEADILVMESTFGLPSYSFPQRELVYEDIAKWINEKSEQGFVILAGYSLGKAQELTAIVNKYTKYVPLVHERIARNNEIYKKHGVDIGKWIELNHNLKESPVLIMPPSLVNHNLIQVLEHSLGKRVFSAMATGWDFRNGYDKVFPLSDHADFGQLMNYVQAANPKLVLTVHGFAHEFAGYVQRRLGIAARPLQLRGQKLISEFG